MLFRFAAGRTVTASSTQSGSSAAFAVDVDVLTMWTSSTTDTSPTFTVDLGSLTYVNQVRIVWDSVAASLYDIQISTSGTVFTDIVTGVTGYAGCVRTFLPDGTISRFVRIVVKGFTGSNTQVSIRSFNVDCTDSEMNSPYFFF